MFDINQCDCKVYSRSVDKHTVNVTHVCVSSDLNINTFCYDQYIWNLASLCRLQVLFLSTQGYTVGQTVWYGFVRYVR